MVKLGDPLSTAVFILYVGILSKSLNSLFDDDLFLCYGMPKWSTNTNHPSYADNTIIFASTNVYLLVKIVYILNNYEINPGHKIKRSKSAFFMHQNAALADILIVQECTGLNRGKFSLNYLGCPK